MLDESLFSRFSSIFNKITNFHLQFQMAWLKEEGFGGIMVWSVDMDDFRGSCGTGKYPLITAMKQELGDYKVRLEYDGPYESSNPNGQYTTKDRK